MRWRFTTLPSRAPSIPEYGACAIPVIASLNGVSPGGWARYAGMMEQAGADAIELNIYAVITDPNIISAEVEQNYCDLVR